MSETNFRPTPPTPASGGDMSPFSGANGISRAPMSAGVESQLTGAADIGKAHQFFNPGAGQIGNAAISAPIGNAALAAPIGNAVIAAPGALMPLIPGAAEPISPLIQLIMRMPGHIGLLNSFFECIGSFFFSNLHAIGLDTALLDLHAHVSSLSSLAMHLPSLEHFAIDPSILPHDASILQGGLNLHSSSQGLMTHADLTGARSALNVSGGPDLHAPQFEHSIGQSAGPGQSLSGPSMSDGPMGNHLANGQRMFGDRFQGSLFSKPGMHGSMLAGANTGSVTGTAGVATSSSLNVGGSPFGAQPQALPAVAQTADGLSGGTAPAGGFFGGNDSSSLAHSASANAGDSQLLAANPATDSFRPSLGGQNADASTSYLQPTGMDAAHSAHIAPGSMLKQLHAKELSLDSVTKPAAPAVHKAMEHASAATKPSAQAPATKPSTTVGAKPAAPSSHTAESGTKIADASEIKAPTHHDQALEKAAPKEVAKPAAKTASKIDATKNVTKIADTKIDTTKIADSKVADNSFTSDLKPNGTYTIRSGDCLWNIAKNQLGSAAKWQDIYKLNQDVLGSNPSMIHSGMQLKLPGMPNDVASNVGSEASKYVVKPGDNLWNIAKDQLHDATKWGDLYKANTEMIGSNARLITPGQELTLPGHENALVADAGGAAAPAQIAQAPMGASGPMSPTAPVNEFGSPATADSAMTMSPAQSIDGSAMQHEMMQAQAAPQASPMQQAPGPPAPVTPAHATMPQHVPSSQPTSLQRLIPSLQTGPGAAIPAPAVHVGPGAASAGTLHTAPFSSVSNSANVMPGAEALRPVVKSTLGSDLANFLATGK